MTGTPRGRGRLASARGSRCACIGHGRIAPSARRGGVAGGGRIGPRRERRRRRPHGVAVLPHIGAKSVAPKRRNRAAPRCVRPCKSARRPWISDRPAALRDGLRRCGGWPGGSFGGAPERIAARCRDLRQEDGRCGDPAHCVARNHVRQRRPEGRAIRPRMRRRRVHARLWGVRPPAGRVRIPPPADAAEAGCGARRAGAGRLTQRPDSCSGTPGG